MFSFNMKMSELVLLCPYVTSCFCVFSFSVFNTTLSHGARAVDAIKTFEQVVVLGNQSLETSQQVNESLQEIMNRVRSFLYDSYSYVAVQPPTEIVHELSGLSVKQQRAFTL